MPGLHETFAAALRASREGAGWSQAQLAERVGLSVEAYGRLERGRVLPRAATLVRLSRALRVSLEQLLGLRQNSISDDELRVRAIAARLQEADPEDVRILLGLLSELQRWRQELKESLRLRGS